MKMHNDYSSSKKLKPINRFLDPKNDIAFKKIFGHPDNASCLISLQNELLHLKDDQRIIKVDFLSTELLPATDRKKKPILDISCTDKKKQFIVEIQNAI